MPECLPVYYVYCGNMHPSVANLRNIACASLLHFAKILEVAPQATTLRCRVSIV